MHLLNTVQYLVLVLVLTAHGELVTPHGMVSQIRVLPKYHNVLMPTVPL